MPYTIFIREQVLERSRRVPDVNDTFRMVANLGDPPAYPAGAYFVFSNADFDRYSAAPELRRELIFDPAGSATLEQILAAFPACLDAKKAKLWEAASAWERRNISGVALSLLTLGVAQQKPKALAIAAWSNHLWNDTYYPRKALISLDTEPDCDFSSAGDMPFSVPELSAEVWG